MFLPSWLRLQAPVPRCVPSPFRQLSWGGRGVIAMLALVGVLLAMPTVGLGQTATLVPTWIQASPASSPSARLGAAMAYDPATGQVVLFGGTPGGTTLLNDTWTFNGTTWTQQSPATSPPARDGSMMTYDAATGKMVLFGGVGPNNALGDTWTYDGTTWTQQSPATSPSARYLSGMDYDAATGKVVLFGGTNISGWMNDTWTYNGTTWTQQSPATRPSTRYEATMRYDPATSKVVLFGGYGDNGILGDAWTYNGTTWAQLSTASTPFARTRAMMEFDAATGQMVLSGGYGTSGILDDTWTYNGTNWTRQSPTNSPSGRYEAATAYDAATSQMVLFGGEGRNNAVGDTWTYGSPTSIGTFAVGSTSATQTATLTITTSGSLSSISALTQGATELDFKIVQPNTAGTPCTVGTAYLAGDTCTVQFTFTPLYPGLRAGGLRLSSSSATLATALLTGTGTGPLVTFPPGTNSSINTFATSGFVPGGVAVDGSGVIYFSSYASDRLSPATYRVIEKIPVGCTSSSCFQTVTSSVLAPTLLALDAVGNLYVSDNSVIERIPPGCTSSVCMSIVGGGFQFVTGLAVDSVGNVYVSDQQARAVYEVPPGCTSSACGVSLGGGSWQYPTGVAVDGAGNVYVADGSTPQDAPENDQGQLHVMPPNCTNAGCVTDLNNAFGTLGNISADGVGNLYALDTAIGGNFGAGGLYEMPAACRSCMVLIGSGYYLPAQSAVTGNGTIYVADTDNHQIAEINLNAPATVTFPSTMLGQTSATQSVTLSNAGNAPLIFAIPGTGNNPSVSANFSISNSSTCPLLNSSSFNTASLAPGSSCSQILSFAPTMAGTITGSSTVTDNNLNATGATQSIPLSGTATKGTPTVSVVSPSVAVDTTSVTLEADISTAGVPSTGAVTFTVNGGSAIAATCTGSSSPIPCIATYNPSSLTAGSYSIVATIAADSDYNSASGNGTLTITQGTPALNLSSNSSTSKVNDAVTFTASVSPASGITPGGKVSFSTTLNGTASAIAGCTAVSLVSGAGPSLKATCKTSTLNAGSNSVIASLAADSNFNTASSNTVPQTVNTVAATVALSSSNSSSIVNGVVTFTATVTPATGITPTGAVSFTTTLNGSTGPIPGCTSVALVGGVATCTTSALQVGSNTVKASIASDANFQAGSRSISQTVAKATPTVAVQPVTASPVNSPLTFVASVSPASGILPTGTVSFSITLNGTTSTIAGCATVPLVSATSLTASCTTSALAAGSNSITASLASDANFNVASSSPVSQTVNKGTPSLSLSTTSASSTVNTPVSFTATATPSSGITPTGNVSFSTTLNGTTSPIAGCTSVPLSALSASCTTSALGIGSNAITASIVSDSNFNAATSNTATETVNPGPLAKFLVPGATIVAGANPSLAITAQDAFGNTVTSFNGTVNLTSSDPSFAAGPSGNDTITIQNGVSSTRYQLNTAGAQSITAIDTANSAITGTGSFTVLPGAIHSFAISTPATAVTGVPISLTVTGSDLYGNPATNYTGTVHFTSTDPVATLPANATLTNGTGTFNAAFGTPGAQTITATDTVNSTATGISRSVAVSALNLIVTTLNDDAGSASNCSNQSIVSIGTDSACSLRDAVLQANNSGTAGISFAPALTAGATTAAPATIALAHEIDLSDNVTMTGPGANLLRVSGNQQTLIFKVGAGTTVAIDGLTLTGGFSGLGGAINNSGVLTLTNDTISGNAATLRGGGIYQGAGSLTVVASTINNNTAFSASTSAFGGGIDVASGSLTLEDSTLTGNTGVGGGLFSQSSGTLTIIGTTITGNTSPGNYGGIELSPAPATIGNSIIAGNTAAASADVGGSFTDNGGNLIGVKDSGGAAVDPLLSALGYYGGPTQTMVPLPGSPVLCAGTAGNVAGISQDQRGFPRATTYGGTTCYDAGSVQSKYALAFVQQPTAILAGQTITPAPTVQLDEQGSPFSQSGIAIGVTPSAGSLTGTTGQTTGGTGLATFSGLSLATAESGETLTANLALSSSVAISTTSNAFNVTTPAPVITSVSPTSGPATGGTSVTITGTHFTNSSAVKFGATSASYTVNSSTQIAATAPAGAVGSVDVTVTTPGGTSAISGSDQFTYVLATKTINFTPLISPVAINSSAPLTATASNGDPVTFSVTSGTASIHTVSGVSTIDYTNSGSVTVTANSAATSVYAAAVPVSYTVVVNQIAQTITFQQPSSPLTYSTGLSTTLTASASSGLAIEYKVISGPANVSGAILSYTGPGTVVIEADQTGDSTYTAATPVQRTIVLNAVPAIAFTIPNQTYGEAPFQVNATSNSSGAFTYTLTSGNATVTTGGLVTLTGVGPVTIGVAQAAAGNFTSGMGSATFTAGKGTATIILGNLTQTYTGSPLPATGTTNPVGLNVSITYAGSPTAPTAAGSYAVVATIVDANYSGSTTGTLVISKATATVALSNLSQTYTGSPLPIVATTAPTGLNVSITYAGSSTAPTAAGSYAVVATIVDANYSGSTTGTLVISKATATVALSNLTQTYTGSPLPIAATTAPTGLNVSITYAGSSTAPTAAGSYAVVATIVNSNYSGSTTGTLVISKATATVVLSNLSQTYTGSPLPVTASTTPTGLNVSITYASSPTAPTAAGSYAIVANVVDSNYSGNITGTLVISKATATVVLSNLSQTYTGSPLPIVATTTPTGLNVSITYAGSSTAPTAAGSYAIVANIVDANYSGSTTGTLVISKATATVALSNLAQTYTGSPLPVTATTTPTGLKVSITYAGSPTAPTAAGSDAVVANIVDANYSGSTTGTLVISKATATVALSNLSQTYTGSPLPVTATTTPTGLNVSITYASSPTAPTAAGSYAIVANIVDANYSGSTTGTLVISKATATVVLNNLAQTYTGSPLPVTASTIPTGLNVSITYAGSPTAPTASGSYAIVANVVDANYSGSTTGTLVISKANATVALSNLTQTYTGSPLPVTATTTPTGLNVSITYAGSPTAPISAGSYLIVATIVDSNYSGSTTGTLVISKATATVALSNLTQTYTGSPLPVTASTTPTGLNVSITYAGSPTAPTAAGSYAVIANVVDANYSGSTTGTLVISKATSTVALSNLTQTYTGSPLPVTASTTPTGLNVSITYAGSPTAPTASGSYAVVANIVDANYSGSTTGTLVISKATATIALSNLTQTYTGSPLPVTASTTPTGLNVSITYAGSPTAPTASGSYAVVANIVDANYSGSTTGTLVISKATATVVLNNLAQTYTGSPLPVTASTIPTGLNVSITYAGSPTAPTVAGSYAVVATISDSNYSGNTTGTLVISKATASVTLGNLSQTYTGSPAPVSATTNPVGLNVSITYAGSPTVPTAAGSYAVVATISDPNYSGNTTGTLVISKASATITLGNLTQTYTGLPLPITATSNPAGLTINITYESSPTAPTVAGTYGITATIADSNYTGSATRTLLIQQAPVVVSLVPTSVSAAYGSDERLTIAVTPAGAAAAHGATPAGTVTLLINGSVATVALSNGDGTYDAGILPSGLYTVTADYNGDTDYTGVISGSTVTPLFTITSGSLLVTANNATRLYGVPNPTFTGNVSGQQNGDTFNETFTTTAVQASPVGSYPIVPLAAGSNLADYTVSTSSGTLSITRAGTTTTAVLSANSITTLQTLTVNASVQSTTTGTPTGSVQLLDGTSVIATTNLNGNTAAFSLSNLAAGAHSLSVSYLGDNNFTGSTTAASQPVTVIVVDFVITSSNGTQSQTVVPGQTALYTFQITPETGGYPGVVTFTVSGLPPGATAVFTPNNIPVNGGPQTVTLSITTASVSAAVEGSLSPGRRAPILLGLLLLPLAGVGRIRRRQLSRVLSILLLFVGSIATLAVLTGCGSGNGYFVQTQRSYSVTVTVTSGAVVHTENVNLTVE